MKTDELLSQAEKGKSPSLVVLRGDNPYLVRELKKSWRKAGWEIQEKELKKTGPDPSTEDLSSGMSLFQTQQIIWLRAVGSPNQWSEAGARSWKKLSAAADGEGLVIVLQGEADKRIQWAKWGADEVVDLKVEPAEFPTWIKKMNQARGNFLTADKMRFLSGLDSDLMLLDNWIELWLSGGDLWAERSLGWGRAGGSLLTAETSSPVFAWVDAVLGGKKKESVRLLKKIMDDGEEPFQFLALLSKSVRIWAQLEAGRTPHGQPDFLVQKLSRLRSSQRPGAAKRLLKITADLDRLLKSSPAKAASLLMRL